MRGGSFMTQKKIISFSLWGNDPKYCLGAIENARLAAEIYPDWICRFYTNADVSVETLGTLANFDNVELCDMPSTCEGWKGMFARFFAVEDDVMISRDCDSRLSWREKEAVDEWLESDKGFHVIRDHPWHTSVIMGGMWGCRNNALPEFLDLMLSWDREDRWQTDQEFLETEIWPLITGDVMIHDSFYQHIPFLTLGIAKDFPTPCINGCFVGQAFEADGSVDQEHVKMLSEGPLL